MFGLTNEEDVANIEPRTWRSVRRAIEREGVEVVQFDRPLPARTMEVLRELLAAHPEVGLPIYSRGQGLDHSVLRGFEFLRSLDLELYELTDLSFLANFTELRHLAVGATRSKKPSLTFLEAMPHLESLSVEGHARGFDSVCLPPPA